MEINAHVFYLSSSASAHRDLLKKTPKTNTTTPQKRNQTKPNTPAPLPALDLCGIKVVIGVQTLSNRQAPSSLRPCWPAALCHCIPCQAAAPIHGVCLHLSLLAPKRSRGTACRKAAMAQLWSSPHSSYLQAACAVAVFVDHGVTMCSPETK